jgi:hypothetical protein
MAISNFKFVSPGVFLQEIDKSKIPTTPEAIGPVVIGRTVRGPAMRPVKVNSYAEFVELFGEPSPGGQAGDIWRDGNYLAPTFGAYAAKAYLANQAPLTMIRLLGYQNDNFVVDAGEAGWKAGTAGMDVSSSAATTTAAAFGLFVAPIVSSSTDIYSMPATTGTLAAIIYTEGATVSVKGAALSGAAASPITAGGAWIRSSVEGELEFSLVINDGISTEIPINFTENSSKYLRKKLNTNPTLLNTAVNPSDSQQSYFLGESFATHLKKAVTLPANGSYAACIVALKSGSASAAIYKKGAEDSSTGWIVSQDLGANTAFVADGNGEYANIKKLFRLVSLTEGEWNQNNIKISIEDIKPSTNDFNKFGSFSVVIRSMFDTDSSKQPLEVYTGLTLDPSSPNYIARRIGDKYSEWDYTTNSFREYNLNDNMSKFVRVEVTQEVEDGGAIAGWIPFGFYGPKKYRDFIVSGSSTGHKSLNSADSFLSSKFYGSATPNTNALSGNAVYTASLVYPELPLVSDSDAAGASSIYKVYWGVKTNVGTTKVENKDVIDLLRTLPSTVSSTDPVLVNSFLFSLDDVKFSGSVAGRTTEVTGDLLNHATWAEGNRAAGTSFTARTGFSLSSSADLGNLQRVNRFTMPLFGGFDGFDIKEKEPFSQRTGGPVDDSSTETTSYAVNSIKVAINSIASAEALDMNIATIPGIQHVGLTTALLDVCESRGDALAIIDLKGDATSKFELYQTDAANYLPDVDAAIQNLKARSINNSYGCSFFPAVIAKDTTANATVIMPSSVIALGTMASSTKATDLWFAPAGFNRGGLSQGAGGLPVIGITKKLKSTDRDALYEVNINPIASFPSEGLVVFGQKTLQVTPSALDRINVRRLMIYLKKEISRIANSVLFDPNVQTTWDRFTGQADPFLSSVKSRFGLSDYKLVLDSTTTTPELIDRNILYAKIFVKPARAIEFIALDFIITRTGASFDD